MQILPPKALTKESCIVTIHGCLDMTYQWATRPSLQFIKNMCHEVNICWGVRHMVTLKNHAMATGFRMLHKLAHLWNGLGFCCSWFAS